jgi:hypothetical protein
MDYSTDVEIAKLLDCPANFCTFCEEFSRRLRKYSERRPYLSLDEAVPHQLNYTALRTSASAGCSLCQFICDAIPDHAPPLGFMGVGLPGSAHGKFVVRFRPDEDRQGDTIQLHFEFIRPGGTFLYSTTNLRAGLIRL